MNIEEIVKRLLEEFPDELEEQAVKLLVRETLEFIWQKVKERKRR